MSTSKPRKGVYAVVALAMLSGVGLTFAHFDPIKALYWSALVNGLAALPNMALIMVMCSNARIMGEFAVVGPLRGFGWVATGAMGLAAVGMFWPVDGTTGPGPPSRLAPQAHCAGKALADRATLRFPY
jgi:Mn2+/Fe2+ NRAMP family transporter